MISKIKRIDTLSITECCEQLNLKREHLPNALHDLNGASEFEKLVIDRLDYLLDADESTFQSCSTIEQYENYLVLFADGLYRDDVTQKILELKDIAEEIAFYQSNKDSISGCETYLEKYPDGKFVKEVEHIIAIKEKRRKIRNFILFFLFLGFVVIICLANYSPVSYLFVSKDVSLGKRGGLETVSISTDADNQNVEVREDFDWMSVSRSRSNGSLSISVEPNKEAERIATITIDAYSSFFGYQFNCISKAIKIKQKSGLPTFLRTNLSEVNFDKYGKSSLSHIIAETDGSNLQVSTTESWFTVEKSLDEDGENVVASITLSANTNNEGDKTGEIVVSCNEYVKSIPVSQESGLASRFEIEDSSLIMAEEGNGEGMIYPINVDTDGTSWNIVESPEWLSAYANIERSRLEVSVGVNSGKVKKGKITLMSNNGDLRDISVMQHGDPTDFRASRSTVRFTTSSDYEYVTIYNDSHKEISISEYESWISTSVIDKNRIKISCNRNYDDPPRSGIVYVCCGNEKLSIKVTQNGWTSCGKCGGDGKKECSNLYVNPWNTEFGSYAYGWVNGNHVLRRVYTSWTGWMGAPELKTQVKTCEICDGKGYVKCSTCDGIGKIEESY